MRLLLPLIGFSLRYLLSVYWNDGLGWVGVCSVMNTSLAMTVSMVFVHWILGEADTLVSLD